MSQADAKAQFTLIMSLSAVEKPPQPSRLIQDRSHSQSSAEETGSDTDKPSRKHEKGNLDAKASMDTAEVANETAEKTTMAESSDEDDMCSEDEQLVFATNIGKLIRPTPSSSRKSPSGPQLEEGQSEEEDGYKPTIVDEKPPSELDLQSVRSAC